MTLDNLIEELTRLEKEAMKMTWGFDYESSLLRHLPAILSALKENKRMREALESSEEYFDGCADAEYFPDRAAPVPNEEMRLLQKIRAALQPQGEK